MQHLKVAYLLGSLNRGGTETLLLDVFRNAAKAPFDFMGIHRKGGAYQEAFYATSPTFVQCAPQGMRILSYLLRLRRILLTNRITIVHAQQCIDAVYARLATIGTNIKVVQTFHGYDYGAKHFERLLIAGSIRISDAVCFVSNTQKQYYIDKYRLCCLNKLHTIYNGVNFDKLKTPLQPIDFLNKKDPIQRLQLAMVGNFVRVRAQNFVCQFLHLLHQQGVAFDFYFVGNRDNKEPWQYDDCVAYCQDHHLMGAVHFVGSRNDVPHILRQIDAFVYASSHDTFGIAVVEAIAAGIPVFVNDWEVMREITHNGEWATLYRTDDVQDLLQKFLSFVEQRETFQQSALHNAQGIQNAYSIEQHVCRLGGLYRMLS